MTLNNYQKVAVVFTIALYALWLVLFLTGTKEGIYNYWYSFLFGLTPLVAGLIAMFKSKLWGGYKTALGKAVLFIGLGIFLWGFGEMVWSYYNFFEGVPAPYPSIADIGFGPSIFFYGLGAIFLSRVTGAKFGLRSLTAKFFVILAPVVSVLVCYYLVVIVARGGVLVPDGDTGLKTLLDISYPLGSFLSLMVAIMISGLSFRYLGGKHTKDILAILLGLLVMFIGDTGFSYTTTLGTFYNANWVDLLLATGTFLLSFGVLGFSKVDE